jgi:hypothetical protein
MESRLSQKVHKCSSNERRNVVSCLERYYLLVYECVEVGAVIEEATVAKDIVP